jgi:acetolactate synthase-1/2/3 large subunit
LKLTGAQGLVKALELENVTTIFGSPGAAICPFYDALLDSDIKAYTYEKPSKEQHMLQRILRVTGKTGVCVATSGPGASTYNGDATAYSDQFRW